jgi:hypothetical protein
MVEVSILGETDPDVLREWLRGRVESSTDEWDWVMSVLHDEDLGMINF